ncbi:helicase associated domain-containing protein [Streptomyces sp. TBY4]|uniref:helicase associated domain-containing protein n=1 Tax=Streptomyces sp. TBY4 TaxID=2962030 RepID=UPI0020B858C1|nr:helicase associated domain-containing protein [Streptomyces sp. TBY4]MCP3757034.1 helicase associated domain-containing protein [Streptomyces sp. TBY4]
MKPAARARKTTTKASTKPTSARAATVFQKGLEAFSQYVAREGTTVVGRAHTETLPDGTQHRTGVWIANQKARRDQLDTAQLHALAEMGLDWAR